MGGWANGDLTEDTIGALILEQGLEDRLTGQIAG
jgi:hypothetical protein